MTRHLLVSVGLLIATVSCGGAAAQDRIASLGGSATTTTEQDGPGGGVGGPSAEFQDAMVRFAECMREHGIDFPDPQAGDGGLVVIGPGPGSGGEGGGPPTEAEREELDVAQKACQPILDAVADEMPQPSPEQQQEMLDDALAFAQCMRDHGVDWPDPQIADNGGMTMEGPPADPNDPDVKAALDECGGPGGGFGFSTSGAVGNAEVDS